VAAASTPATIFCVEDEPCQLLLRKLLFESEGYTVTTAESGQEALTLFQAQAVDLVILDYWLQGDVKRKRPVLNGVAVAREMKQLKPNIPIIIFSAYQSFPAEVIGIADAWLRKVETEPKELLHQVETLLKRYRSEEDCATH